MFKWHASSGIGRSRALGNDFAKVADGIAASLRQFSICASRYADDGARAPKSRSERSAEAFKEVDTLDSNPSKGIDARSLAAKPPGSFVIRREYVKSPPRGRGPRSGGGSSAFRGNFTRGARGGQPGAAPRRGGMQSRGRRARKERGHSRDKGKKRRNNGEEDLTPEPYTTEEMEYVAGREQGFLQPYNPTTSAETLARWGPPVISSHRGINESIIYKMQNATDRATASYQMGSLHLQRIAKGSGTFFETVEQRAITEAYNQKRIEEAEKEGLKVKPMVLESLSGEQKNEVLKQWVAGQYVLPKSTPQTDIIGQVEAYTRRNETYLPGDARKLQEKLQALLPAQTLKQARK